MSTIRTTDARFGVGDIVSFSFGLRNVAAQIIEDRGPIGVKGRRLYRVRFDQSADEPIDLEIPEEEVALVKSRKDAAIEYFKSGGLIAILKSNQGGKGPRVWLMPDPGGAGILHTFAPGRGFVGGKSAPLSALHGDKIFTPKRAAVVEYLTTFGLDNQDADEVVDAIGTAA